MLAGDSISYFTLESDQPSSHLQLLMIGQVSNVSAAYGLSTTDSRFASVGKRTYILDADSMYLIKVEEEGPKAQLTLVKVEGYEPLTEYG